MKIHTSIYGTGRNAYTGSDRLRVLSSTTFPVMTGSTPAGFLQMNRERVFSRKKVMVGCDIGFYRG
ncbi:MAG: hypothetical protein PHY29_02040 [Syntrophales bacterium]|nr:hypothetical protein [Syntrophales bacterium]